MTARPRGKKGRHLCGIEARIALRAVSLTRRARNWRPLPLLHHSGRRKVALGGVDTRLSLPACSRVDNGAQWAYGKILEPPGAAEAQYWFQGKCPGDRLMLLPRQQTQAPLSAGTGGSGSSVDGSEEGVCFSLGHGRDPTRGFRRPYRSVRRSTEERDPKSSTIT